MLESLAGRLEQESGNLDQARSQFVEALDLAERTGDPLRVAEASQSLGLVELQLGDPAGLSRLEQAAEVYARMGSPDRTAQLELWLSSSTIDGTDPDRLCPTRLRRRRRLGGPSRAVR